jgi:DNA-binding NtrC family response regulator
MATSKTLSPYFPILLVDDEKPWLNSLSLKLRTTGISNIICCSDSRQVLQILTEQQCSAMVLDLIMPHVTGDALLPEIIRLYPNLPVIIITGLDQVDTAVSCMQQGAFDYQVKGSEDKKLLEVIKRAIELSQLRHENERLKERFLSDKIDNPEIFKAIVTGNKKMRSLFQYVEAIAQTNEPVLITGETGVGKELFAKALHKLSKRSGEFVPVNIPGLDREMLNDSLFGHKKGAFTGADTSRDGLLHKSAGGTLFLDEIGDLDQASQVKLLRLIQEKEYFPLGSDLAMRTDARMIFATLHDLRALQNPETFRPDLFYRLRAHHIHIPPLRERLDDLPLLLDYFLEGAARQQDKRVPAYPKELLLVLENYAYPGNIRELKNMIFDAVSKHSGKTISMASFKAYIKKLPLLQEESPAKNNDAEMFTQLTTLPSLKKATRLLVREALQRSKGNQAVAAEMLGVTRQALNWRIKSEERKV